MSKWKPKNGDDMRQHHVIGKIIFELHTSSSDEVNNLEQELRALIADLIKPKLEEYCNEIDEQDTVLRIDRIELDFGKIKAKSLETSINSRMASCFAKQDSFRRSIVVKKLKEEQSDIDKLNYFIKTGLLPWRSTYTKNNLLPSVWIQNLFYKDPQHIVDIVKRIILERQHLQRFILHASDELLMHFLKTVVVPVHLLQFFQSMKEIWEHSASFESTRIKRLNFWIVVINIFFKTNLKTKESIFCDFLKQWASCQNISVNLLMRSLNQEIKRDGVHLTEGAEFLSILSLGNANLSQAAHQSALSRLADEINKKQHTFSHNELAQIQIKLLGGIFNQMPLFKDEQRKNLISALCSFLETLPDGILTKRMIEYLHSYKKIALSKVSFLDDLNQMQGLLQKINPVIKNEILESNSIIKTIHELLDRNEQIDSIDQFILFLEKLQPVIQALPVLVTDELVSYITQLKVKLTQQRDGAEDVELLKMFYHFQNDFVSLLKKISEEEIQGTIQQLNKILKIIPQSAFEMEKQKHYQKVILIFQQIEAKMPIDKCQIELVKEINVLADHKDANDISIEGVRAAIEDEIENDIYIRNAGLVLIAPFIKSLFERIGYLENNIFVDDDAIHRSVVLLQCVVAPEQECTEYDLPLNKLLCGKPITAVTDITKSIQDRVRLEAEDMLSAILQQTDVFRNISNDGFRNAFLNREGVLSLKGSHWLLKVSKETFDVVLDKLPWQYHTVRLPWMKLPILIEW